MIAGAPRLLVFWITFTVAFALAGLQQTDQILSIPGSLFMLTLGVGVCVFAPKLSRLSLLPRLGTLVYLMPFLHGFEYLDFDFNKKHRWVWGLTPNAYNTNPEIVSRLVMLGSVGIWSLAAGFMLASLFETKTNPTLKRTHSLGALPFLSIILLGIGLSWIFAPTQTISEAYYTQSEKGVASTLNFNAAWLVSYCLLALTLIDALKEKVRLLREIKLGLTFSAVAFVAVYLQFMRGKRDCAGLIAAFLALYLTDQSITPLLARLKKLPSKKILKRIVFVGLIAMSLFLVLQTVGYVRSRTAGKVMTEVVSEEQSKIPMINGTWSAALETPLSVIGDFYYDRMDLHWGSTYLDYFLSLPPGIVTHFLGYERPLEGDHGPAWEMRYGLGGTHLVVVPLMNFGVFGVVFFLMLFGFLLGRLEATASRNSDVFTRAAYGTAFIILPFWFWYGDMYLIRGAMSYICCISLYRFLVAESTVSLRAAKPMST